MKTLACKKCNRLVRMRSHPGWGSKHKKFHGGWYCDLYHRNICGHKLVKTRPKWCEHDNDMKKTSFIKLLKYTMKKLFG